MGEFRMRTGTRALLVTFGLSLLICPDLFGQTSGASSEDEDLEAYDAYQKCYMSARVDKDGNHTTNYSGDCKITDGKINTANTVNQAAQAAGVVATQISGQINYNRAASDGKMSSIHGGASKTMKTAAVMQGASGAANAVMAQQLWKRQQVHKQNIEKLKAQLQQYNEKLVALDAKIAAANNDPDSKTALEVQKTAIKTKIKKIHGAISDQQTYMENAKTGKVGSGLQAAMQFSAAAASLTAARGEKNLQERLEQIENQGAGGQLPGWDSLAPPEGSNTPRQALAVTGGNGGTPDQHSVIDDDDAFKEDGGLGEGFGMPVDDKLKQAPPAPGGFQVGRTGGVGGGGGGSVGFGGGSVAPSQGSEGEPGARYAENAKTVGGYEVGGGAPAGGGRGGAGGGAGDSGPDLSGMLAQFLPKEGEEEPSGPGILEYSSGDRALASESPDSLLGRHANLFDRIHQAYQEKQGKGLVGLRK